MQRIPEKRLSVVSVISERMSGNSLPHILIPEAIESEKDRLMNSGSDDVVLCEMQS